MTHYCGCRHDSCMRPPLPDGTECRRTRPVQRGPQRPLPAPLVLTPREGVRLAASLDSGGYPAAADRIREDMEDASCGCPGDYCARSMGLAVVECRRDA